MATIGRVCVVGAGPAGLSLARAFLAQDIPFDMYERRHDVGGLWDQANPGSPVYDSAHFISSRSQSHFHDFPMPEDYPDYPRTGRSWSTCAPSPTPTGSGSTSLDTGVTSAVPDGAGWKLTLSTGEVRSYASLVCANGTNWHPVMPSYPGVFAGEMRHTQTYRSSEELRGKRVLIIGAGNRGRTSPATPPGPRRGRVPQRSSWLSLHPQAHLREAGGRLRRRVAADASVARAAASSACCSGFSTET